MAREIRAHLSSPPLGERYSRSTASSTVALNFLTPSFCGFLTRLMFCLGLGDFCWGLYEYGLLRRSMSGVISKEEDLQSVLAWSLKWSPPTCKGSDSFPYGRGRTCLGEFELVEIGRLAQCDLHHNCSFHQAKTSKGHRVSKPARCSPQ